MNPMLFSDALYEKSLDPRQFLPIFREIEEIGVRIGQPILIYHSCQSAGRLLPKGPKFRDLMYDSGCLSIFSSGKSADLDTFTFFMLSTKGGIFIEGKEDLSTRDTDTKYLCHGSANYQTSIEKYNGLKNLFFKLEENEANRLEAAINRIGNVSPNIQLFDEVIRNWNSQRDK